MEMAKMREVYDTEDLQSRKRDWCGILCQRPASEDWGGKARLSAMRYAADDDDDDDDGDGNDDDESAGDEESGEH